MKKSEEVHLPYNILTTDEDHLNKVFTHELYYRIIHMLTLQYQLILQ